MLQDHESANNPNPPRPENDGWRLTDEQKARLGTNPPRRLTKLDRKLAVALSFGAAIFLLCAAGALFYFAFLPGSGTPDGVAGPELPIAEESPTTHAATPARPAEPVAVAIPATAAEKKPPPAPAEASPPPPPQPSAALQAFVDSMTIAGVRTSPGGNRVIINGRMHATGDRLPQSRELELVEIAPRRLVFRDRHGFTYQRSF